jgi:hypothetical protein
VRVGQHTERDEEKGGERGRERAYKETGEKKRRRAKERRREKEREEEKESSRRRMETHIREREREREGGDKGRGGGREGDREPPLPSSQERGRKTVGDGGCGASLTARGARLTGSHGGASRAARGPPHGRLEAMALQRLRGWCHAPAVRERPLRESCSACEGVMQRL